MATVAEVFQEIPSEILDAEVSDEHAVFIARNMEKWEPCAPILGLSKPEQEEIRKNHQGDYLLQKQESLFKWKQSQGFKATYRLLFTAFCLCQMNDLVQKLKRHLLHLPDESASKKDVLENYRLYLQDCYTSYSHPSRTQWPFSALQAFIELSLLDTDLSHMTGDEGKRKANMPISLDGLFFAGSRQAKRKIILLEGVAGSGKTTLSWHSCKEWAGGKLFQHLRLLIHVSLNDPSIQSAKCLADIIPHPDEGMRKAVAKAIAEEHGKGVCFLFDACDEAPQSLWRGFLYQFLEGKSRSMIPRCSIVMTARPEIHLKVPLQPLLTARVIVGGFEGSKLNQFLESSLSSDPKLRSEIAQSFKVNPELVGLCSLPLNAVILVHLYRSFKDNLPSTRTGLFKPLVCNLLIRHILNTTKELIPVEEFSDLPSDILAKFKAVSALAFSAFMEHKRLISKGMLKANNLSSSVDTLGLMQLHQQLAAFGPNRYSFLHLSLQEFLAAVHISEMEEDEQAKTVRKILNTTPLSPILLFYAGLTNLSNKAVLDVLLEVTKKPLDTATIMEDIRKNPTISGDRRRPLLALLNCIYESQDCNLCQLVNPPHPLVSTLSNEQVNIISLTGLGLNPLDYLSLEFFLANASNKLLDLQGCYSNTGIRVMIKHMKSQWELNKQAPSNTIELTVDLINAETAGSLKDLLLCVQGLGLMVNRQCPLKVIRAVTEGIYRCPGPRKLTMRHFGPSTLFYVVLILSCPNLSVLSLEGIQFNPVLAEAIKLSSIRMLSLKNCVNVESDIKCLGDVLQNNSVLATLNIPQNNISADNLTFLLHQILESNSKLILLVLSDRIKHINEDQNSQIVDRINLKRFQSFMPVLVVVFVPVGLYRRLEEAQENANMLSNLYPNILAPKFID